MKKAGIIVGLFFFIAAIVVFLLTNNAEESKNVNGDISQQTQVVEQEQKDKQEVETKKDKDDKKEKEDKEEDKEEVKKDDNEEPIQQVQQPQIVEKVVTKEVSSVKTISESDLVNSKGSYEVISFISNKRIILIDENPSGTDKKTLSYCFDVLTPDNKTIVLFVTKSVYDSYNVQDKLKVNYELFVNDIGVEFPIVSLVSEVK